MKKYVLVDPSGNEIATMAASLAEAGALALRAVRRQGEGLGRRHQGGGMTDFLYAIAQTAAIAATFAAALAVG